MTDAQRLTPKREQYWRTLFTHELDDEALRAMWAEIDALRQELTAEREKVEYMASLQGALSIAKERDKLEQELAEERELKQGFVDQVEYLSKELAEAKAEVEQGNIRYRLKNEQSLIFYKKWQAAEQELAEAKRQRDAADEGFVKKSDELVMFGTALAACVTAITKADEYISCGSSSVKRGEHILKLFQDAKEQAAACGVRP